MFMSLISPENLFDETNFRISLKHTHILRRERGQRSDGARDAGRQQAAECGTGRKGVEQEQQTQEEPSVQIRSQ